MHNSIPLTPTNSSATNATATSPTLKSAKSKRKRSRWRSESDDRFTPSQTSKLRFSPTAWAKLIFLRDYGDTEVGGFGITAHDDLLYVEDVGLVRQSCTGMSVAFNDESVADFFDRQVDAGLKIEQFARIWVHTHPGGCPKPSHTDESTFSRVFGRNDWAVMFILAQDGQSYARLQFNVGPGGSVMIPVTVDYSQPFAGSDYGVWEEDYLVNVCPPELLIVEKQPGILPSGDICADNDFSPANPENWPFFDRGDFEEFLEFREVTYGY